MILAKFGIVCHPHTPGAPVISEMDSHSPFPNSGILTISLKRRP